MKLLNIKNFSSITSILFHVLIFFIIILSLNHKTEKQNPKYVDIGFAGIVESNSPGSPGSGIINRPKIVKHEKVIKKKSIKKNAEISKKSKVEKKPKLNTASNDSAAGSNNSNQNLSGNNSDSTFGTGNGQNGSGPAKKGTPDQEDFYHVAVDQMPVPIGGIESIQAKAFYPPQAKAKNIQGTVYVLAYIDENGYVRKTLLLKGIGYGCDESAVKAVRETRFSPGLLHGVPVKVQLTIPVNFAPH